MCPSIRHRVRRNPAVLRVDHPKGGPVHGGVRRACPVHQWRRGPSAAMRLFAAAAPAPIGGSGTDRLHHPYGVQFHGGSTSSRSGRQAVVAGKDEGGDGDGTVDSDAAGDTDVDGRPLSAKLPRSP